MRTVALLVALLAAAPPAVRLPRVEAQQPAAPPVVDLNSATRAELEAINGIGPTYARRIIRGRPYRQKDDLVRRRILPQAVYDKVKDRIVARQRP